MTILQNELSPILWKHTLWARNALVPLANTFHRAEECGRLKALTERFGPCGSGWKYTIERQWMEPGGNGEIAAGMGAQRPGLGDGYCAQQDRRMRKHAAVLRQQHIRRRPDGPAD